MSVFCSKNEMPAPYKNLFKVFFSILIFSCILSQSNKFLKDEVLAFKKDFEKLDFQL